MKSPISGYPCSSRYTSPQRGCLQQSRAELVVQEHVPEQLDMVTVLGRLAVGIGSAQDERAGVQAAVALPGLVERSAERAVGQVFQPGWRPRMARMVSQVAVLLKVRKAVIWDGRSSSAHGSRW